MIVLQEDLHIRYISCKKQIKEFDMELFDEGIKLTKEDISKYEKK